MAELVARSVDLLIGAGAPRLALILTTQDSHRPVEQFQIALARHGLVYDPCWVQGVPLAQPEWAGNVTRLLMHLHHERRPDGLVVLDDTLTPHVLNGLSQIGCRPGRDVQVVSHCNFVEPRPPTEGVIRIGFDVRRLLNLCLDLLWAGRPSGLPYTEYREASAALPGRRGPGRSAPGFPQLDVAGDVTSRAAIGIGDHGFANRNVSVAPPVAWQSRLGMPNGGDGY